MKLRAFIGIDPGVSGGIAAVDSEGGLLVAHKMPGTPGDTLELLRALAATYDRPRASLELVAAFAPKGQKMGATSAFTFGRGFGYLEMALLAAGIPFDLVVPRRWQAALSCVSGGDKNVTKRRAQSLHPHISVTHATADAMLLAEYSRRHYGASSSTQQAEGSTNGKAQSTETGKGASRTEASSEGREEKGRRKEGSRRSQSGAPRHGAGPRP